MPRTAGPILVVCMALSCTVWAQEPPGKRIFEDRCGTCHGADGNGGEHAPAIARALANLQDPQLTTLIREGLPARGMPAILVSDTDLPPLITFDPPTQRPSAKMIGGLPRIMLVPASR